MIPFQNETEKIEFLRKYKLITETSTDVSGFYYYQTENNAPVSCDIVGYENAFDTWAAIVIQTADKTVPVHSDYLLDMKKRGRAFQKNMASRNYVVLDLETTGLSYKQDEIIEIAAIKYCGQKTDTFSQLIKPKSVIPENITDLTGITNEMVQDADSIEIVLPKFLEFIGNFRLVGHNIKTFDILFINKACQDLGLPRIKNEITDTLPLARKAVPRLANYKLSTICDFYHVDASNAHRALDDCYLCNECYRHFQAL